MSYDYHNKYTPGATEYFCPADFDEATTRRIQDAALGAFTAVGGRDYSRVDVMVRPNGEPVVLEVNTLPGMTELSLLPKAAAADGMDYAQLCRRMIELALRRGAKRTEHDWHELVRPQTQKPPPWPRARAGREAAFRPGPRHAPAPGLRRAGHDRRHAPRFLPPLARGPVDAGLPHLREPRVRHPKN